MKALVFGADGQDGYYLSKECLRRNIDFVGVGLADVYLRGDASDYEFVADLVKFHKPAYIFHLAAISTTKHSALFDNHSAITTGTLNILEAVWQHSRNSKVFIAGSALQFKINGLPISESSEFVADSPYALARIYSVYAARYYRSLGVKVYNGYLFHHESPLRKNGHISQKIALAVKRISSGSLEKIKIGDMSVEKEWNFAGDIVSAMFTLLEQDDIFEVVIGSGQAYSIYNWLDECFCLIKKDWRDFVILKSDFTPEYKRLVSDPKKIFSLGWKPMVNFSTLAQIMVLGKDHASNNDISLTL